MRSRFEAVMDGMPLSSIHPSLVITNIGHAVSEADINGQALANRPGMMIDKPRRNSTSVSIAFMLRIYDIAARQRVMQEIQRWACGKALEVNDRPGQVLDVVCTAMPGIENAQEWTAEIEMEFTAYEKPFWAEKSYSSTTLTAGTSGNGLLYLPGNAGEVVVEVEAKPSSGTLTNLTLTVGTYTITLTGISATNTYPLKITYDERGIQSIKVNTTSVLSKRTGADDLLAKCGILNTVSFTANVSTAVTFKARGCWL